MSLSTLIRSCTRCPLHQSALSPVPFSGPTPCNLLVVGEAPGSEEDKHGTPFIGAAGSMMRSTLAMAGIRPNSEVGWCNVVSCHPPGNRDPLPDEVASCEVNFLAQLALLNPKVVILAGGTALSSIRPDLTGITQHRGRLLFLQLGQVAIPTLHPGAVLRKPAWQRLLEQDCSTAARWVRGRADPADEWPSDCAICGLEVERYDPMGVAYCKWHIPNLRDANQFPVSDRPVQQRLGV